MAPTVARNTKAKEAAKAKAKEDASRLRGSTKIPDDKSTDATTIAKPAKPPTPPAVYSIATFCEAHLISEAHYFKLKSLGRGPREAHALRRVFITFEAAAEWQKRCGEAVPAEV